jgi:hypothetical protein
LHILERYFIIFHRVKRKKNKRIWIWKKIKYDGVTFLVYI